jgi:hypothetical protein
MLRDSERTPRPPRLKLWQEITLVLAIKAITLVAIWWAWFAHPQDKRLDGAGIADSITPADPTPKATPLLPENNHAPRPGTR